MAEIVRAALVQQQWTGDKESMIAGGRRRDRPGRVSQAPRWSACRNSSTARTSARCRTRTTSPTPRPIPDGPTTQLMCELARQHSDGAGRADVRGGAARPLLQHRRRHRRRRQLPRQVPQDTTSPRSRASGRSSTSGRATSATRSSTPRSAGSASTSATTGTSRRAGGRSAWPARGSCSTRRPPAAGLSQYLWRLEQPAAAVANEYFVGAINRVGVEPLGDNDFYGRPTSSTRAASSSARPASDTDDEMVVRDLDMACWPRSATCGQFYRDRRPDLRAFEP